MREVPRSLWSCSKPLSISRPQKERWLPPNRMLAERSNLRFAGRTAAELAGGQLKHVGVGRLPTISVMSYRELLWSACLYFRATFQRACHYNMSAVATRRSAVGRGRAEGTLTPRSDGTWGHI